MGNEEKKGSTGSEKSFTVQEAASILICTPRTVHNLINRGWLSAPVERPKDGNGRRVSEKSLFQFLVYDRARQLPPKILRQLRNGSKIFSRILGKPSEAICLSKVEGTAGTQEILEAARLTGPSPYPLPQGEGKQQRNDSSRPIAQAEGKQQRRLHHEFAERHQFSFGWCARQLAPNDPAMQDDLVQEMSLAVLEYDKPAKFEFLFELANNRAKNYIEYEAQRGMKSLSAVRQASDAAAERIANLNAFIDELMGRGVPVEWIEEVLGERLDVA